MNKAQEAISGSTIESNAETPLVIPALGRPMRLGMVYDCRNDQPIPGFTLWNQDTLKNNCNIRRERRKHNNIISSDDIDARLKALEISGSMKASMLSGLVNVEGSARYLKVQHASQNHSRVTLHYRATDRYEQLSMNHLGRNFISHQDVFEHGLGTHIVTGILYGAQAFFVFEKKHGDSEDKRQVDKMLQSAAERVPSQDFRETHGAFDTSRWEGIRCLFYGDFDLKNSPTNFKEAVSSYGQLLTMLEEHGEMAVPLTVWLYPLAKMDVQAAKFVQAVHFSLVNGVHNLIQCWVNCKSYCRKIRMYPTCKDFAIFSNNVAMFEELIKEFKRTFQEKLSQILPKIREGRIQEEHFSDILSSVQSSPFNLDHLQEWQKSLQRKMNVAKEYMNMLSSFTFIKSLGEMQKLTIKCKSVVLCLSFAPLVKFERNHLSKMSKYMTPKSSFQHHDIGEELNTTCLQDLSTYVERFKEYAEANRDSDRESFAVIGFDCDLDTQNKLGATKGKEPRFIYIYESDTFTHFVIPTVVRARHIVSKSHNAISLHWSPPELGLANVKSYRIKYREKESKRHDWDEFCTGDTKTTVTIRNLNFATTYEFSIALDCVIGTSQFSKVNEVCTTLSVTPPLNVRQSLASFDTIRLVWDQPTSIDRGVCIEEYIVKYLPANIVDAEAFIIRTQKSECSHDILGLVTNTTYRVLVSAVCDSGEESAFSEEVKVRSASERPPAPGKPIIMGTTNNTVSLQWTTPKGSTEYIEQYIVHFRECSTAGDHSDKWPVIHVPGKDTKACIPELHSNTAYEFSVCADYGIWTGSLSAQSDVCTTRPASSPLNIMQKGDNPNNLEIGWDAPTSVCKQAPITKYKVKYQSATNGNKERKTVEETKGSHCMHAIHGLKINTTCTISVSAVCGEAGDSIFSDPVEIEYRPRIAIQVANRVKATEGELSILQLPLTKVHEDGSCRTYHFEENMCSYDQHIVIMLIATKGSGKGLLINAVINYILGVKWEDNFRFTIVANEEDNRWKGRNNSQTQYISSHTINPPAGSNIDYKLTIIDTPCFEDADDMKHDRQIVEQIRKIFLDKALHNIDHINAIGFVVHALQTNLPLHQRYLFNSIFGKCTNDFEQCSKILVTFADGHGGQLPAMNALKDANIPDIANMIEFNFSSLFTKKVSIEGISSEKMFWNMSMQNMNKFLFSLHELEGQSLPSVCQKQQPPPSRPFVEYKSHESVRLAWTNPKGASKDVMHHIVHVRERVGCDTCIWNQIMKTSGKELNAIIPNLKPNTTYESSVLAVYETCTSQLSDISDAFTTCSVSAPLNVRKKILFY